MATCNYNSPIQRSNIEEYKKKKAQREKANKHYEAAKHFYKVNNYKKAIYHYQKCLLNDASHTCCNNGLAWLLVTAEQKQFIDLKLALKFAKRAVSGEGYYCGPCWDTLAMVQFKSGEFEKAHICFLKSMTFSGNCDNEAHDNYVNFLDFKYGKESEENRSHFEGQKVKSYIEKLNSNGMNALFDIETLIYVMDYLTLEILNEKANNSTNDLHNYRAICWYKLKKYKMAYYDTQMAIDLNKDNPKALIIRGKIFTDIKMEDDALENFDKALLLDRTNDFVFL